ncbi:MAG: hypothetical protein N3B21_01905 [Clostridia bacterium]|nr:hypothetical protein [Clostridia bacterium]
MLESIADTEITSGVVLPGIDCVIPYEYPLYQLFSFETATPTVTSTLPTKLVPIVADPLTLPVAFHVVVTVDCCV